MGREKRNLNYKSTAWRSSLVLVLVFMTALSSQAAAGPPIIDVWYGHEQNFGHLGSSQRWVNVLGNVQKGGADSMVSFSYTLNNGPEVDLSIGADYRRLVSSGDFNIDLAVEDLLNGANQVIITAVNSDPIQDTTIDTVTVNYDAGNVWALPYTAAWDTLDQIEDVAQLVDGKWEIQADSTVRTIQIGYDRLIAIGDTLWGDYEVTAPITFNSFGSYFGIGFLLRWKGHTDDPISGWQPKTGWMPYGALCWYRPDEVLLTGNNNSTLDVDVRTLSTGITYMFKARVKTIPGVGGKYSFKVWEQGQPEPPQWELTGQEELTDPQFGSILLVAHRADVSFGTVTMEPVETSLYDIMVTMGIGNTSATVTWSTNQPANSSVAYGLTTGYEEGTESDPSMVTEHSITLNNLTPDTLYHFEVSSTDNFAYTAMSGDSTFSTLGSGLVSDDFSSDVLDSSLWTWVNPKSDASFNFWGNHTLDARIEIHVPGGSEHELWDQGVQAPHIMQLVNDMDFEIEAKFESPLTMQYQQQGFIIKHDSLTFMRFDFYSTSVNTRVFAATINNLSPSTKINSNIGGIGIEPLYMRVKRTGDYWEQTYSFDGETWLNGADFTFSIAVNGVGVYAGNAQGSGSPEHTAYIDYFFNVDFPIDPEDGFVTAARPQQPELILTLLPNQPNPFNPVTLLRYIIAQAGPAQVDIYDVSGRRVRSLVNEWQGTGMQSVYWKGLDNYGTPAASGVYFVRLKSHGEFRSRKIILLK
jgi:regulation of enolase protein 1 (concanavalin A-like superfamily)